MGRFCRTHPVPIPDRQDLAFATALVGTTRPAPNSRNGNSIEMIESIIKAKVRCEQSSSLEMLKRVTEQV
jgi:hypothetical protein